MTEDKKEPTGRAKGGYKVAAQMTAEEKKRRAEKGAAARWGAKVPNAEYKGVLKIANLEIPCFVLDDGRRVISGRGMTTAIGMKGRGQGIARIQGLKALKSLENNNLPLAIEKPIRFTGGSPQGADVASDGFEATVLQELCEALLQARDVGALQTEQEVRYGQFADTLTRAFARVGIIALVDEATGYQAERAKDALATILEAFISRELQPWIQTFPTDYYRELFRLRGLDFPATSVKRPQYFGVLTNDIVYKRLAPGVLEELKRVTPRNDDGRPKAKYFQSLTNNTGYPKLREHLGKVVMLMQLSKDYNDFKAKLEIYLPVHTPQLTLGLEHSGPQPDDGGQGL